MDFGFLNLNLSKTVYKKKKINMIKKIFKDN